MSFDSLARPKVHFATPDFSWFRLTPPLDEQPALPPAPAPASVARPFNIDPQTYTQLLDIKYPITIAISYVITVSFLNQFNKGRKNKAWRISKTRPFFWFVIAHNVFLAAYSAWTCFFMVRALAHTLPGLYNSNGAAGIVDSMCKMSGPRGFGSAVTYNPSTTSWSSLSRGVKLAAEELPDATDVGRFWNEGLGYYGWLFYLSKFYEVIDTLIILAKGKKSSLLQTYHHAGAMFCMWAGIRFMSPPIWMFVLVNSGIHALMYTYYTLSALSIRVPTAFKRSLTTLQITQFVVGFTYAVVHLFVAYDVPYEKPFSFVKNVSRALPTATSSIASVASASAGAWLKKLALRAAGEEGAAEQVDPSTPNAFVQQALDHLPNIGHHRNASEEIRYRWETANTHCIDTPGQSFAILLNALYLLPLTGLFVRFFYKSYSKRYRRNSIPQDLKENLIPSGYSAARDVKGEVRAAFSGAHSDFEFAVDSDAVDNADLKPLTKKLNLTKVADSTQEKLKELMDEAQRDAKWAGGKAKDAANYVKGDGNTIEKAKSAAKDAGTTAKETGEEALTKSQHLAKDLKEAAEDKVASGAETPSKKKKKNKNKNKTKDADGEKAGDEKTDGTQDNTQDSKSEKSKPAANKDDSEDAHVKEGESYADAALKGADKAAGEEEKPRDNGVKSEDETDEERKAREMVERAYAAANQASAPATSDEASETISIDQKDEEAYEANIDEVTSKEEKKAEKNMQP